MAKPADVIRQLKQLPKNMEIMLDVWTGDDIKQAASNWTLEIDDKDIPRVMDLVVEELDPDFGITFEGVSAIILDLCYPQCEYDEETGTIMDYSDNIGEE